MSVTSIAEARQRREASADARYLPGVAPFDPNNPMHVAAWNAIHRLGWAEKRAREPKGTSDV